MSIFPTTILLAADGSQEATLAARTAADIADKTGSELHVVHARHVPLYIEPSPENVRYIESVEENARKETKQVLNTQWSGSGPLVAARRRPMAD